MKFRFFVVVIALLLVIAPLSAQRASTIW